MNNNYIKNDAAGTSALIDASGAPAQQQPDATLSKYAYSWYIVVVLTLANIFSGIDRHIMTVLVGPIRKEFDISDTQFSLLQGAAFTLVYCFAAYPIGRLADRVNRCRLLTVGIMLWSAMTILSGFAGTYGEMVFARIGVGIGEAVLIPAALSLIADLFTSTHRGRPIGIFSSATFLGTGIALLAGGFTLAMLKNVPVIHMPLIGDMTVWRSIFVIVGVPGLVIAIALMLTVKEPQRKIQSSAQAGGAPMKQFFQFLGASRSLYFSVYSIAGLFTFVAFSVGPWLPTMLARKFGMPPSQAGITVGLAVTICGTIGAVLAGWLCDRWTKRNRRGHKFSVLLVSFVLMAPAIVGMTLATSPTVTIAFIVLFAFSNAFGFAAIAASLQDIVPNQYRGQASAVLLIVNGVIGFSLGTTAVALITDYIFHNDAAIGYSILVAALPVTLVCSVWIWFTLNRYDQAYRVLSGAAPAPVHSAG